MPHRQTNLPLPDTSKQDEMLHDTRNIRMGLNVLGNRMQQQEKSPSRIAVITGGVAGTLVASIVGAGLIWGVTQVSKVPALEERVDNVRISLDRLTDVVQELRRTAVSADGSTALRRAEIEGLNKRVEENDSRRQEVDRNILTRMDRDQGILHERMNRMSEEVNQLKTLFLQSERRLSDLFMRRQSYTPDDLPAVPSPPPSINTQDNRDGYRYRVGPSDAERRSSTLQAEQNRVCPTEWYTVPALQWGDSAGY